MYIYMIYIYIIYLYMHIIYINIYKYGLCIKSEVEVKIRCDVTYV